MLCRAEPPYASGKMNLLSLPQDIWHPDSAKVLAFLSKKRLIPSNCDSVK
jgi:hypothetical protein